MLVTHTETLMTNAAKLEFHIYKINNNNKDCPKTYIPSRAIPVNAFDIRHRCCTGIEHSSTDEFLMR
ncbi:hypothetical protein ScPMuIL_012714 [Solemya velum]